MKIPEIKKLVEQFNLAELVAAEQAILEEATPAIEVGGVDEGEQLTHVLAAVFILHEMQNESVDFMTALRRYTLRVRTSIS
jgi:hypothetical protein